MSRRLLLALLCLPAFAEGGVDLSIDEPEYWASTNCRVVGHAEVNSTTLGITAARITIDGTTVWSTTYQAGPFLYIRDVHPIVMFDSTHNWDHLTSLEVTFEVKTTDSPNVWYEVSHSALVKNQAVVLSQYGLDYGGESRLIEGYEELNHYASGLNDRWDSGIWRQEVQHMNVVDINAHGGDKNHETGDGLELIASAETISTNREYEDQQIDTLGSGLPPFNSSNWPPHTFLHLQVCNCGDYGNWDEALYPGQNYYSGGLIENQAVLAYNAFLLDDQHYLVSNAVMTTLEEGYTVAWTPPALVDAEVEVSDTEEGEDRLMVYADAVIFGDTATRVTSVYTGTSVLPVGWYRVIPG